MTRIAQGPENGGRRWEEPRAEEDALAGELVDRWAATLLWMTWAERLTLITKIHEKLIEDLGDIEFYNRVAPRFTAGLIGRLGQSDIVCDEQAHIYANSADEAHRQAARAWIAGSARSEKDG